MRIVVAGNTGFVGNAIVAHALKLPVIEHIYAICRLKEGAESVARPHSKVTEIRLTNEEFHEWPQELIDQLKKVGVKACIWCIGGAPASFPDLAAAEDANSTLPIAAATALSRSVVPTSIENFKASISDRPFRFVYMSVSGAEQNPNASLWTQIQLRKMKGYAEKYLFEIQTNFEQEFSPGLFEVFALRLGRVLPGGKTTGNILTEGVITSVNMERVVKVACDVAVDGWWEDSGGRRSGGIIENKEVLGDDWADVDKLPAIS